MWCSFSYHILPATGTNFFFTRMAELMRLFTTAFTANAYIITSPKGFFMLICIFVEIRYGCTIAKGAFFYHLLFFRIIEIASARAASEPFTVKIDLSPFNNYLASLHQSLCNFLSGSGINAGEGWPRYIHYY